MILYGVVDAQGGEGGDEGSLRHHHRPALSHHQRPRPRARH